MGTVKDRRIIDGWEIEQDILPSMELHTGKIIHPKKYTCINCKYRTGEQARKFRYCPICGDRKGNGC